MGLLILLSVAAALVAAGAVAGLIHGLRHPPRKTYAVALGRGDPTEPEAVGLIGEAATLRLADGSATPVWFVRGERASAENGAPPAPVVIVLHGFGDSRYGALTWAPLLTPFASEVVLFDQRGQGESEATAATPGVRETTDVTAIIDQVLAGRAERDAGENTDADAPPVVLFGYSMGAMIALGAAASEAGRQRVAGVIADGPYRHWYEPVREVLRRRHYPTEPVVMLARCALWLISGSVRRFDRARHAERLACPLLVLHGSDDPFCPIESARTIAAAAPDGELVEFEGCSHLDLAAHEPERYRDALARFFARLAEAGSRDRDGINDYDKDRPT